MEGPVSVQSAVRLPTPPPPDALPIASTGKRKRSPPSRSPSPRRRPSPSFGDEESRARHDPRDVESRQNFAEPSRPLIREKIPTAAPTEDQKQAAAKAEYDKLVNARSGGLYIPPARLRALQSQITDKASKEFQRMAWEALKSKVWILMNCGRSNFNLESLNGVINKVNISNIKYLVGEIFLENLIRGRGLFCRSVMKAQASSLPFTPIYAALCAIVNTKLPQVGQLLVTRLVVQFKKAFKRNDKAVCLSSTTFLAHLVNYQVVHETLVAEILLLLLQKPTDDSVEIAVGLTREVGQHLEEMNGPVAHLVFDQFRNILHEQDLDKRVQYQVSQWSSYNGQYANTIQIEVLFQIRKDKYKDNPAIRDELDLIEEEDQITHQLELDDDLQVEETLNIFKFDVSYNENEEAYKKIKAEILGVASGSDDEQGDTASEDSSDDEEAENERQMEIKDMTSTDLTNLRRTIYLTIMSSIDYEECAHKLMKLSLPVGQEAELPAMIIETCSQERTYNKFHGGLGERFAKLNRLWMSLFEEKFKTYYDTIHRYEANRLRNIARFQGHMLASDAIGWHVLSSVTLTEENTTSSSRIFLKILFQELLANLGMSNLQARLKDEVLAPSFEGIFPKDNPRNIRFSINYFTSIGIGAITEDMRQRLKTMPAPAMPALPAAKSGPGSDSESVSSYSSYTSSSRSYSRSRSPPRNRGRSRSRSESYSSSSSRSQTPPRRGARRQSYTPSVSRSRSPAPRPHRRSPSYSSRSRSPPRRNGHARNYRHSRSPSLPPRRRGGARRGRSMTHSVSPTPHRRVLARKPSYTSSLSRSRSRSPPVRGPAAGQRRRSSPPRSASPYQQRLNRETEQRRPRPPSRSPPPPRRRRNTSSPSENGRRRGSPVYDAAQKRHEDDVKTVNEGGVAARGARQRKKAEDFL